MLKVLKFERSSPGSGALGDLESSTERGRLASKPKQRGFGGTAWTSKKRAIPESQGTTTKHRCIMNHDVQLKCKLFILIPMIMTFLDGQHVGIAMLVQHLSWGNPDRSEVRFPQSGRVARAKKSDWERDMKSMHQLSLGHVKPKPMKHDYFMNNPKSKQLETALVKCSRHVWFLSLSVCRSQVLRTMKCLSAKQDGVCEHHLFNSRHRLGDRITLTAVLIICYIWMLFTSVYICLILFTFR